MSNMAYYGARQHQHQAQPMPFNQVPVPMGYNNARMANMNNSFSQHSRAMLNHINMTMANQGNLMVQNFLQQNGQRMQSDVPAGEANQTLEIKVVAQDMTPKSILIYTGNLAPSLNQMFASLPRDDAVMLQLVEVFSFLYRRRLPHEPDLMPNAQLYFTKLKSVKSTMCDRIDQVTGFRCCACRHTSYDPNLYLVGAAQLVTSEYFMDSSIVRSLSQLKNHMLTCPSVRPDIKSTLKGSRNSGKENASSSLEDYLGVWLSAMERFSAITGFPKIKPSRQAFTNEGLGNSIYRGFVDPSVGALRSALGSIPQRQAQLLLGNISSEVEQVPEAVYTEDELISELEETVLHGLVGNNFGIARLKPRIVAGSLSEFPMSDDHDVSPFLELLLQSLCAIQKWTSPPLARAGTKRNHDQDIHGPKSQIYFVCNYCRLTSFCASSSSPRDAADFIVSTSCDHLCEECGSVPSNLKQKLGKMRERTGAEQRYRQKRVVENSFGTWKSHFPGIEKMGQKKEMNQTMAWRPLTWKFVDENGGECIADASLAHQEPSVLLEAGDDKKLPHPLRSDDVVFGWNGKHLGNLRFLSLLAEARPAAVGASTEQQKFIACEVMRLIRKRGGHFYSMAFNPMLPPVLEPPEKAIELIFLTMKRGNIVLCQPPVDLSRGNRASRVLECELAPQRSLFGKEIVRNKRFKKCREE